MNDMAMLDANHAKATVVEVVGNHACRERYTMHWKSGGIWRHTRACLTGALAGTTLSEQSNGCACEERAAGNRTISPSLSSSISVIIRSISSSP